MDQDKKNRASQRKFSHPPMLYETHSLVKLTVNHPPVRCHPERSGNKRSEVSAKSKDPYPLKSSQAPREFPNPTAAAPYIRTRAGGIEIHWDVSPRHIVPRSH